MMQMLQRRRRLGARAYSAAMLGLLGLLLSASLVAQAPLQHVDKVVTIDKYEFAVTVPEGWQLEPLIVGLRGARMLTFHPNGDLFAGSSAGVVYRIPAPYRQAHALIELDDYPHSVAFRGDQILIARTSGLYSAPYSAGQQHMQASSLRLLVAIPGGPGHNSRTVAIGPDKRIYLSLGISGNCSDEYADPSYPPAARRGGVMVLDENSTPSVWQGFASGLRNPVGFDWHPQTEVAYASNNGPDHLGFDQPGEYFARLSANSFHGMPWFQWDGTKLLRDECITRAPPRASAQVSVPAVTFAARNAPMAVKFLHTDLFGQHTAGDAIVALRGSWGTAPSGAPNGDPATRRPPQLVLVRFKDKHPARVDELVSGFQLTDGRRWLRPVGLAIGPDKAIYISADAGFYGLYRLRRD
jgi:glucose/arabinose dehydrogenase